MGKAESRSSPARAGASARRSPCISPGPGSTSRSRPRTLHEGEAREHSSTVAKSDTTPLPGSLDVTAELIEKEGRQAFSVVMDLTDRSTLEPGVEQVLAEFGRIDVLVNNGRYIGPGHMDRLLDTPVELLDLHLEANVMAPDHPDQARRCRRCSSAATATSSCSRRVPARRIRPRRPAPAVGGSATRCRRARSTASPGSSRSSSATAASSASTCIPDSSRPNESSSTWLRSASTAAPARRPTSSAPAAAWLVSDPEAPRAQRPVDRRSGALRGTQSPSRLAHVNATDVVRTSLLDAAQLDTLRSWTDEVEAWPTGSHVWGHYAEHTAHGPRICRTENVSACHPGIASLVDRHARRLRGRGARRAGHCVQGQAQLQTAGRRRLQPAPGQGRVPRCRSRDVDPGRDRRLQRRIGMPVARERCRARCSRSTTAASCRRRVPRTISTGSRPSSSPATRSASTASRRTTARRTAAHAPRRVLVRATRRRARATPARIITRNAERPHASGDRARRTLPHQHARRLRRGRGRDRWRSMTDHCTHP